MVEPFIWFVLGGGLAWWYQEDAKNDLIIEYQTANATAMAKVIDTYQAQIDAEKNKHAKIQGQLATALQDMQRAYETNPEYKRWADGELPSGLGDRLSGAWK